MPPIKNGARASGRLPVHESHFLGSVDFLERWVAEHLLTGATVTSW